MKKTFKKISWFVIGVYAIVFAIEIGLGINIGFVTHALISPAFTDMPLVSVSGAMLMGILVGFGSFGLFVKTEEAWSAIKSYTEYHRENFWIRASALIALNAVFVGIDILGMLYRLQFLSSRGVAYLAWIGVGLALVPLLIGLVLNPMIKQPASAVEDEALDSFSRNFVTQAYGALESQPLTVRQQAFNGDMLGALGTAVSSNKVIEPPTRPTRYLTSRLSGERALIPSQVEEVEEVEEEAPLPKALRKTK